MTLRGTRPNPAQWLGYALGRRLPQRCNTWVLHDITCRTWAARHFLRGYVQMSPILLLLLLPGPLSIRALSILLGLLVGSFYSMTYLWETTEQRLVRQGYPRGMGAQTRRAVHADADALEAAAYRRRYRSNDT
ncbi:DUF5313 family protein [Umezawaea sp. Da 62-37]|uniref:DUF5313 family protein n=1 Tax=Umezawaea sp. Da 62-37 TaxID=3075927 RepID=UPI0028F72616|nr:DUF5313 family protein [Umezawaea sp. Da 62-37]WNV84852.1 DUF5313 family protein [Umezawaea sp. Da 62-37]